MPFLPAEWEPQRFIQLTWPHKGTDWAPMLEEVNSCFVKLALSILRFEPLLIVCSDAEEVKDLLLKGGAEQALLDWILFVELPSNDTWARDHGGIKVMVDGQPVIYDYAFNGWGRKFEAGLDNELTRKLYEAGIFRELSGLGSNTDDGKTSSQQGEATNTEKLTASMTGKASTTYGASSSQQGEASTTYAETSSQQGEASTKYGASSSQQGEASTTYAETSSQQGEATNTEKPGFTVPGYRNCLDFVLEGGSLESDGNGTLLTTSECLLSEFRNPSYTREMIEQRLKEDLGLMRVLWLNNGYLEGDDTDSHIDTLARFCDRNTIAYVRCDDPIDAHFEALQKMEAELKQFTTIAGQPYRLLPLPMADAAYDEEGNRLPATYANFLIVNGGVLVPTYGNPVKDEMALNQLRLAFPEREVVGVDCRALVEQHGSLHCVTMQY